MGNSCKLRMAAPAQVYRQRRARLAAQLRRPLVIFAGHAQARNYPTNPHPFRAASTYLYFGGPPLEDAALVIEPQSDGDAGSRLIRPVLGPDDKVWFGPVPTDAELSAASGIGQVRLMAPGDLEAVLKGFGAGAIVPPCPQTIARAAELRLPRTNEQEIRAVVDLRLIKDEHELDAMRRSAEIAIEAHRAALAACTPGGREADVAAAFTAVLVANESDHSFNPIITVHGEVLHSEGHPHELRDGALLLIDAGAEEPTGYASDITRTVPVNGRWTAIQRQLYETARKAMEAAIAVSVPGRRFREVHDLAARVICEGLVEAELLRGDPAELAARTAHALFFPHGVGHLIGLDVHDMEDFGDLAGYAPGRTRPTEFGSKFLRLDRDLAPGMTVTIEPGIYLIPAIWATDDLVRPFADVVNRPKVEALLRDEFGGIRVEQTICIRQAGTPEVISEGLPTAPDEITQMLGA
jgi:Xaa-Pro aminopeptidase